MSIITLTKHPTKDHIPPAPQGDGAPEIIALDSKQIASGREALREWLADGKDSLNVTNRSLDMALSAVITAVFRKEVSLCA